jgi:cytochrome c
MARIGQGRSIFRPGRRVRFWIGLVLGVLPSVATFGQAPKAQRAQIGAQYRIYSQAQAEHGKALYRESCMGCHGDKMQGGESVPPLAGPHFLAKWGKLPVGSLFGFISTQMPLGQPGSLGNSANVDVVAYILFVNKMPPGKKALPAEGAPPAKKRL